MRTILALVTCVLVTSAQVRTAFGPLDLELRSAAEVVQAIEGGLAAQARTLAVYLEASASEFRALVELPLVRELSRVLRLERFAEAVVRNARAPIGLHGPTPVHCLSRR